MHHGTAQLFFHSMLHTSWPWKSFPLGFRKNCSLNTIASPVLKKNTKGYCFLLLKSFSFKVFYRVELVPLYVICSLCSHWNIPGTGNLEKVLMMKGVMLQIQSVKHKKKIVVNGPSPQKVMGMRKCPCKLYASYKHCLWIPRWMCLQIYLKRLIYEKNSKWRNKCLRKEKTVLPDSLSASLGGKT